MGRYKVSRARDLTDWHQPNGRLRALKRVGTANKRAVWHCACDCGETVDVLSSHLMSERVRSCGCLIADTNSRPQLAARNKSIRRARKQGKSYQSIAIQVGLSHEYVRRVCGGEGA